MVVVPSLDGRGRIVVGAVWLAVIVVEWGRCCWLGMDGVISAYVLAKFLGQEQKWKYGGSEIDQHKSSYGKACIITKRVVKLTQMELKYICKCES